MVIKERKACLQEFLQNYKLGYYSVTRPFPSFSKGVVMHASVTKHGFIRMTSVPEVKSFPYNFIYIAQGAIASKFT